LNFNQSNEGVLGKFVVSYIVDVENRSLPNDDVHVLMG